MKLFFIKILMIYLIKLNFIKNDKIRKKIAKKQKKKYFKYYLMKI